MVLLKLEFVSMVMLDYEVVLLVVTMWVSLIVLWPDELVLLVLFQYGWVVPL